ncbi:MAG: FGGY-family carbohydrate kinase [Candidatus Sumerlaeia bacterium]
MSYLGLDIGTSGCKAAVFDEDGKLAASSAREYATVMPQEGWAELDSREVLDACMIVISEAAGDVKGSDPVRGIGISSQGEAFTPVDASGNILMNSMVSFDTRALELSREWSESFGRKKLYEKTGHTPHPMFSLYKLLWLKNNEPEIWSQAKKFLCFEELIQFGLGLEPAISYPMAGRTMLFDVRNHVWDSEILDALELKPDNFAKPLPSGSIVGTIAAEKCRELNLAEGTIVVTGGHDQPCGALGAGVLSPGKAMYGMGTVECICPAFEEPVFGDALFQSNLCTYDFTMGGMYTTVAFCLTGGNLLRWYRDEWGHREKSRAREENRDVYEVILEGMPEAPTKLMVLPYFTPSGTPYFDSDVRGAILGLQLSTKREEVLKALLEGVSYEMKLNVSILEQAGIHIDEFIAIGGGAKSQRLSQLKADVLNRPITTVSVTEAGCLGVAMLARAADRGESLQSLADKWVRTKDILEPDPQKAASYEERFLEYKKLYYLLKGGIS